MTELAVSEVFGPTVQGEGPNAGHRCGFVRLGRCNLNCSWCDTPYTWDWKGENGVKYDPAIELHKMTVADVIDLLKPMRTDLVVVTGGEPLLQRKGLTDLALALHGWANVEVETNGTQKPLAERYATNVRYNVSPKLANSGIDLDKRIKPEVLDVFADTVGVIFKFVCVDRDDLIEVRTIVNELDVLPESVWIMPEGRNADDLRMHGQAIADEAIGCGYNVTGRLHVMLWGDERGR